MLKYTFGRILSGLVTIWFIATATFLAMHAVPGDPLMNEKATTPEIRENLARKYGLDKPIAEQYVIYLGNMVQGDFGISFTQQNRKVNDIIQDHFPVSAALGILAITFAALGGILWGALTALYRNQLPDIIIMFLVILGISVPSFVFAALGQLLLVNINQWFNISFLPVAGWGTFAHMIVPSLVLGLGTMALLTRLMRSSMLEIVNEDFIRTARAKGLSHRATLWHHALRNALIPVVTILGLQLGGLFSGALLVETVFNWPGLGRLAFESVLRRDYPLLLGLLITTTVIVIVANLLTDLVYRVIDPRIRIGGKR